MAGYDLNDWLIILTAFVLGLLVGMLLLAGSKWKRRYREEVRRREEVEAENERLRKEAREMDSLRGAAAKAPPRDPSERGPV